MIIAFDDAHTLFYFFYCLKKIRGTKVSELKLFFKWGERLLLLSFKLRQRQSLKLLKPISSEFNLSVLQIFLERQVHISECCNLFS